MTDSNEGESLLTEKYPLAIGEAMEGAGVAAAAWKWNVACGEVRTISNFVGQSFGEWEMDPALERLKSGFVDLKRFLTGRAALP
jgi:futalosine hydrolase